MPGYKLRTPAKVIKKYDFCLFSSSQANDDVAGLSNVLNTVVIGFSINDVPQLVGPVIKMLVSFPLFLSRSVLMELQKLFMQILFLSRVWIAVLYHVLLHS